VGGANCKGRGVMHEGDRRGGGKGGRGCSMVTVAAPREHCVHFAQSVQ